VSGSGPYGRPLPSDFFERPAEQVARALLGAVLVSAIGGVEAAGRIVETEAYIGPHDPASHAAERIGRTLRNASMFGPPGTAYIYRIYGIHWCLNTVTDAPGFPAAVLIRALEPQTGLAAMQQRRARAGTPMHERLLCSGPGRLAAALAIDGSLDGVPLQDGMLRILAGSPPAEADIIARPRVGITRAAEWPLRFYERDSRWISRR
jgi:DNA-3-methyladenine glycosylase